MEDRLVQLQSKPEAERTPEEQKELMDLVAQQTFNQIIEQRQAPAQPQDPGQTQWNSAPVEGADLPTPSAPVVESVGEPAVSESRAENPMITTIHEKRKAISILIRDLEVVKSTNLSTQLSTQPALRSLALSITKLDEAKMWLGRVLGDLGSSLPKEYRDDAE